MSLIRVCDVCGKVLDREHTKATYTIKKKIFTPMYKGINEKNVNMEICDYCMSKIIEKVLKKKPN